MMGFMNARLDEIADVLHENPLEKRLFNTNQRIINHAPSCSKRKEVVVLV